MDQKLLPFALQDVPRYTSYPTAVQFQDGFPGDQADRWLAELPRDASLSIYVHVPFCQQLCWYCGCHTSVPNSYGRASAYVDSLLSDITRSGKLSGAEKGNVKHLHFGGGTPTYLSNADLGRILACINGSFGLAPEAEIALESDPRGITRDRAFGLAAMGFNRISFGVQDFSLPVQMKINRLQTHGLVAHVAELLREAGFTSINFDLMYGLPAQTAGSVRQTAKQAAALRPSRISVFGYAHVPWFKKHQRMISDSDLPGVSECYDQASAIAEELGHAGYAAIGLDRRVLGRRGRASPLVPVSAAGATPPIRLTRCWPSGPAPFPNFRKASPRRPAIPWPGARRLPGGNRRLCGALPVPPKTGCAAPSSNRSCAIFPPILARSPAGMALPPARWKKAWCAFSL